MHGVDPVVDLEDMGRRVSARRTRPAAVVEPDQQHLVLDAGHAQLAVVIQAKWVLTELAQCAFELRVGVGKCASIAVSSAQV